MDLFDYLRGAKINTFEEDYVSTDPTLGPSPFRGLLGMKKKLDNNTAAKFSNTALYTFRDGIYMVVRSDPAIVSAGDWVLGRPLGWVNKQTKTVTTIMADTTVEFAGVALGSLTKVGTIKLIQIAGVAPVLLTGALTKAAPLINDPVSVKIAANLATGDVIADATGWTNVQLKAWIGNLVEAAVAGSVKQVNITQAHASMNLGIM